jgi:hypothetical protein
MLTKTIKHKRIKLTEAEPSGGTRHREFMSDMEKRLKRKLIDLLRDDGKGHHHAKYAERLDKFDVQIVPLSVDDMFTAAISFDTGIIYIGEGFLNDPSTFYQLNVLIRHELAHNLLMHQIRMAYKLGEEAHVRMRLSSSIFKLYNIIADDEISNRKYSEEDKIVVRNMMLNGQVIGGLVTEDHRDSWTKMSIEEMYDQICAEIEEIHSKLLGGKSLKDIADEKPGDIISNHILNTYIYSDTHSDSMITVPLQTFIDNDCSLNGQKWKDEFSNIAKQIYSTLKDSSISDAELKKLLDKIAKSSPVEKIDLFNDKKVELYMPEEKLIAVEVLKKFKSEYTEWYDKVLGSLNVLNDSELRELLDVLK